MLQHLFPLNFLLQSVEIRYMINPSQHNFELKIVTRWITWMDNVSHRHHRNLTVNKPDTTKIIHQMIIVTT